MASAAGMPPEFCWSSNIGPNDMIQDQENYHAKNTGDKKTSMLLGKPEPHLQH